MRPAEGGPHEVGRYLRVGSMGGCLRISRRRLHIVRGTMGLQRPKRSVETMRPAEGGPTKWGDTFATVAIVPRRMIRGWI